MTQVVTAPQFYVEATYEIDGHQHQDTSSSSGWYLLSQAGTLYEHGPARPLTPCDGYATLKVLISVNGHPMSINEIEMKIKRLAELEKPVSEIKQIFEDSGITQVELAQKLGLSQACISQLLNGKRRLCAKMMNKILTEINKLSKEPTQ